MSRLVVADAGPLHYLILVDCVDTLENIFDKVMIPGAVWDELSHSRTAEFMTQWRKNYGNDDDSTS